MEADPPNARGQKTAATRSDSRLIILELDVVLHGHLAADFGLGRFQLIEDGPGVGRARSTLLRGDAGKLPRVPGGVGYGGRSVGVARSIAIAVARAVRVVVVLGLHV